MSLPTVRIAILDDYQDAAARYFPTAALQQVCSPEIVIHRDRAASEDDLVDRAGSADVVVAMRERSPMPAEVIERLTKTRLIVTTGPRNAAIDAAAAAAKGITVCGTYGRSSTTAEHTWAILMALVRRIPAEDAGVRAGRWGVHVGDTLAGKTLGVLGMGTIGREIARYGRAFGMTVLGSSRSLTRELAAAYGCEPVDTDTLFGESDVVSVHLRLNDETRGCIGWRQFGLMKPTAYFVNTARGGLVDADALLAALREGKIAGAALDVHDREPLPADSPFLSLDNVVLTPHIGYVSDERYRGYFEQAAEDIVAYLRGRPIREIAHP